MIMEEYIVKVYQDNCGKVIRWYQNDQLHRLDGPACIVYYENGNKWYEYYYLNGKRHNENGPAQIFYYPNGNKKYEYYHLNNTFHNEYGPATIHYDENGNTKYEHYYLNNVKLSKEEWSQKINKDSCDGKIVEIDGNKYKLTAV